MSYNLAVASVIASGLAILLSVILWKISRMSSSRTKATTVYLCGDAHSGKTKLYYSLISSAAQPTSFDTVKTVDGAVYTGCIDSLPGKLLRLCDIPSDQRCRSVEALASPPAIIVYIATKGHDNSGALIPSLLEAHQFNLKLLLVLAMDISSQDIISQVSHFIATDQNIDPKDVVVPAFLQVVEVSSVNELLPATVEAMKRVICK